MSGWTYNTGSGWGTANVGGDWMNFDEATSETWDYSPTPQPRNHSTTAGDAAVVHARRERRAMNDAGVSSKVQSEAPDFMSPDKIVTFFISSTQQIFKVHLKACTAHSSVLRIAFAPDKWAEGSTLTYPLAETIPAAFRFLVQHFYGASMKFKYNPNDGPATSFSELEDYHEGGIKEFKELAELWVLADYLQVRLCATWSSIKSSISWTAVDWNQSL